MGRYRAGGVAASWVLGTACITGFTTRDENRMPEGVVAYNYTGGEHTNDAVAYTESPPVGGTHNPAWQTCDFYDGKMANENVVHSLEHGAVWVTYRPDISEADKERLEILGERSLLSVGERVRRARFALCLFSLEQPASARLAG